VALDGKGQKGQEGASEEDEARQEQLRCYGLTVVWLALFCDYLLMTIVIPIFPSALPSRSEFEIGVLFSSKAAMQLVAAPLVAHFIDGCGLVPLIVGLLVEALSTLLFAGTEGYGIWLAARAVQGVASSMILSAGVLPVQQLWAEDQKAMGVAMAYATTGIISGVTFGPPVGGLLYEVASPLPFLVLAVFIGLTAVVAVVYYAYAAQPVRTEEAAAELGQTSTCDKVCSLLHDPRICVTLGALLIANAAISCLESTLGYYLEHNMGMSTGQVGLIYVTTALPSVICSSYAGDLGNWYGRWVVILVGMVIQGSFLTPF